MFVIIVVIAGKQLINILPSTSYTQLYDENVYFSNTLLQPGYPSDWTPADVLVPGIANNNRLDETKLAYFDAFTYDQAKSYFHVINNFIFQFRYNGSILLINGECNHGYAMPVNASTCEPEFETIGYTNLVRSSRLVIYNSTIIEMELFSWN